MLKKNNHCSLSHEIKNPEFLTKPNSIVLISKCNYFTTVANCNLTGYLTSI